MIKKTLILGLGALALGGGACARTTAVPTPAPSATPIGGPGRGAVATAAGVRVAAHASAWQWGPADIDTKVTPILLELQNDGAVPVLVRYNRIALTDSVGHRFAAMPPYDTQGSLTEAYTIRNPIYAFDRFEIAPYLGRWYPRFALYDGAFAFDPAYYTSYVTQYRRINLPTAEMVQRALPEGVLSPGGRVSGFVYFEPLDRDARTLVLSVEIVNAHTENTVAMARIPFVAR
jgi:hypothetical protein